MNYFKSFGYVTCAHAVSFANDLKLAHYIKVSLSMKPVDNSPFRF